MASNSNSESKEYKSPEEYYPERRVFKDISYADRFGGIDFSKFGQVQVFVYRKKDHEFREKIDFVICVKQKDSNIVYHEKFTSFLCELEMFNWKNIEHDALLKRMSNKIYHDVYSAYLVNNFGNNITLLGGAHTDNFEPIRTMGNVLENRIAFTQNSTDEFKEERKRLGLKYNAYAYPFLISQTESGIGGKFSMDIFKSDTRYMLFSLNIWQKTLGGHFTFVFVDHENKHIEFYDPHGGTGGVSSHVFIYRSLKTLFEEYTINEFWKLTGIQATENLERDKFGFCSVWGHIMMHLKLLNINKSMKEIEDAFILECATEELSLYEVMLNYAYFMNRIISESNSKFVKFDLTQKLKT